MPTRTLVSPPEPPNRTRPSVLTDDPPYYFKLKAFYRIFEVAEILDVDPDTVKRFIREGHFPNAIEKPSQKKDKRAYYLRLIPRGDLLAFIEEHRWSVRRRR